MNTQLVKGKIESIYEAIAAETNRDCLIADDSMKVIEQPHNQTDIHNNR
jgi:hypothetical protein